MFSSFTNRRSPLFVAAAYACALLYLVVFAISGRHTHEAREFGAESRIVGFAGNAGTGESSERSDTTDHSKHDGSEACSICAAVLGLNHASGAQLPALVLPEVSERCERAVVLVERGVEAVWAARARGPPLSI